MGGIHETKGRVWCFLIAEDASLGIGTRNILCLKNTDMCEFWSLLEKEQNLIDSFLIFFALTSEGKGIHFINMEVILNALGRKEVIYSLHIWCSSNSSVGECSAKRKARSSATLM